MKRLLAGRREGFFIGKYRLLDILGQGGMGRVYLAEQITMKRAVALKLIRFGDHENPTILVRFAREARAAAKLRHPNITQAFDFDQAGDYHYIAMEFIEGITLQDWIQKCGVLPWAQAAYYVAQAASALEHAHQAGLVHRDVKPGNLMVDVSGSLKLLDLGLVNIPTEDDSLTLAQRDLILGTADYVAPEQAMNSHDADIRADLYSLGGVFYYLLTGNTPFSGKSAAQKIIAHQTQELRPISEVAPDVPKRLADVVHKLMAKKPEDRYQTPTELMHVMKPFAQAAARSGPPYDVSLVRFNRETVDKYLRFGVDTPPANNVPPANFGQSTMGDFRIPADLLTPKPTGDLGSSIISKPVTPKTPRGGTRKKSVAAEGGESSKSTISTLSSRSTPIPPNKKTMPAAPRSAATKKPKPKLVRDRAWYTRMGVFFVVPNLLAVVLIWALLFRGGSRPGPNQNGPAVQSVVLISRTASAADLAKAITSVAAEGQILLEPRGVDLNTEPLAVTGSKLPSRGCFTLASKDKSKPVTLVAVGNEPILRVSAAEELLLRDLILDGAGHTGPVIEMVGANKGITLQNVTIRNVTGAAVRLIDFQGQPDKPLRFINCTFEGSPGSNAISCEARSFDTFTRNVEIIGCTFADAAIGVRVASPIENVAIRNCVFSKGGEGIHLAPAPIMPDLTAIHPVDGWRVTGPFAEKSVPTFNTELPGESQKLSWKMLDSAVIDVTKEKPGVRIAHAALRSATAGPRRLFLASDDEATVWVNGQKVFDHNDRQNYLAREFSFSGNFHSGDNLIWVQTKANKFALEVAENFLPLTNADWRNVKVENNMFDGVGRGIEFGVAPTQESMVRVIGNQFRHTTLYPLAVYKGTDTLRPGTIIAAENTDSAPAGRPKTSADFELLPLR